MSGSLAAALQAALAPQLGALAQRPEIYQGLAAAFAAFDPSRDSLDALAEAAERRLFNALYALLGPGMAWQEGARRRRVRMETLPELADAALGALFAAWPVCAAHYAQLKDYSLRSGSLSALQALHQRYAAYQSPEERALLARILQDRAGACAPTRPL